MFRRIAGICVYADDLAAARGWYTELLRLESYFVRPQPPEPPAYIEFRIGDDEAEFGILDRGYAPAGAANPPGGAVTGWQVDDIRATVGMLLAMGATEYEPIAEQEDGFITASVIDPFGNVLGVVRNPHRFEIRVARSRCERREHVLHVGACETCRVQAMTTFTMPAARLKEADLLIGHVLRFPRRCLPGRCRWFLVAS